MSRVTSQTGFPWPETRGVNFGVLRALLKWAEADRSLGVVELAQVNVCLWRCSTTLMAINISRIHTGVCGIFGAISG